MADTKFLDYSGLQYFYNKLLTKFPEGTDFDSSIFTVESDENGNIESVSVNLGDSLKVVTGTGGAPDKIEVDLNELFTLMFEDYTVPAEKISTDTVNGGKSVIRVNPDYLKFEYPDSNTNNIRLTVNMGGIGEGLASDDYDPTDPTDIKPEGVIYYNTSTNKLEYELPAASANTRGGITVGDGLEITTSTTDKLKAKVDGTTIEIDSVTKALKIKDNAFCPLTNTGTAQDPDYKVPTAYLPSYVDDVIEGYYRDADPEAVPPVEDGFFEHRSGSGTELDPYVYNDPITGEANKIYVDLGSNRTFRWSGSVWVEISSGSIDIITNNDIDTIMNGSSNNEEEEPQP